MKRIIDGQTYNTDTAARVAAYEYKDDKGYETKASIYVTRGGAFFIVHSWQVGDEQKHYFEAIGVDEVHRLVTSTDKIEIIDGSLLVDPPEAQDEGEPGSTLYIRVPSSFKKRVDEAAKHDEVSANRWAMRCLERCLSGADTRLANAYGAIDAISAGTLSNPDVVDLAEMAKSELEIGWRKLGLMDPTGNLHLGTQIEDRMDPQFVSEMARFQPE